MLYFDSDYMAGAHPTVMQRLVETNMEHTVGYGCDQYTQQAKQLICKACNAPDARIFFLTGGTQTNATIIDGILDRHEGVLAAESSHINVHEAGAIEATGHKVLTLPQHEGKVWASEVEQYIKTFYSDETYEHMVSPGMLYISFPTEYGTTYSLSELEELSKVCHNANIPLFIDGARLGYGLNAEGSDVTLPDIARLSDVFYIGGTKVGTLFGEAVVITNPSILRNMFPLIKQHGALLAKGRLLGLQFLTLFENNLYNEISCHAVELAIKLRHIFNENGYNSAVNSNTNQQFFILPNTLIDRLKENVSFELWGPRGETHSTVRFVVSWATSERDIDELKIILEQCK